MNREAGRIVSINSILEQFPTVKDSYKRVRYRARRLELQNYQVHARFLSRGVVFSLPDDKISFLTVTPPLPTEDPLQK